MDHNGPFSFTSWYGIGTIVVFLVAWYPIDRTLGREVRDDFDGTLNERTMGVLLSGLMDLVSSLIAALLWPVVLGVLVVWYVVREVVRRTTAPSVEDQLKPRRKLADRLGLRKKAPDA